MLPSSIPTPQDRIKINTFLNKNGITVNLVGKNREQIKNELIILLRNSPKA